MPKRHGSIDNYRYGFQGQEKDDEVKGEGNSINYKFRMHDPRVGRFFAVDPLSSKYPHNSPYAFSENTVIHAVELEGLEKEHYYDIQDAAKAQTAALDNGASHKESKRVFKEYLEDVQPIRKALKEGTIEAFKLPFMNNGGALNLIDHYGHGRGTEYNLTRQDMIEMFPRPKYNVGLSVIDFYSVGELKPGETKDFSKKMKVYSGTSGTLGNTYVTITGKISLNVKTKKLQFDGKVVFDDVFDFNAADRHWIAEGQVTIARWFLPGEKFDTKGSLDVTQEIYKPLVLKDTFINPADPKYKPDDGAEHSEGAQEAGIIGQ